MRALTGAGVTLEPQVAAHAAALFVLLSDPALYAYLDYPPPVSEAAVRERLARLESRRSPDGAEHWLNWVVRTGAGALAGYVQATVYADGHADIGYVIGSAHQRRGYALAATGALLEELAGSYGVVRARATVDPENAGSLRLLAKLGFAEVADEAALPDVCLVKAL